MNHASKREVPLPGIASKNRYQTIIPSELRFLCGFRRCTSVVMRHIGLKIEQEVAVRSEFFD